MEKILILLPLIFAGCISRTPQYDRAKEVGCDYSEKYFEVYITGERKLGNDENFEIYGHIKPIRKIIALGENFKLSRKGIISFDGIITEMDKDHFKLKGHYIGKDRLGNDIDIDINEVVSFGIHGGNYYFMDPKMKHMSSAGLHNDHISISKIEKKNLPNKIASE